MSYAKLMAAVGLALVLCGGAGAGTVISDPLAGSTIGQRNGGTFTGDGWRINASSNYIRYTPNPISSGAVEFDVKGLAQDAPGYPYNGRGEVFVMYDASYGNSDNYGGDFDVNPYKFYLRKIGVEYPEHLRNAFKLLVGTPAGHAEQFTQQVYWDIGRTYRIKVTWGNGMVHLYRNSIHIHQIGYSGTYSPTIHRISIGSSARNSTITGAIYSNVLVSDDSVQDTPTDTPTHTPTGTLPTPTPTATPTPTLPMVSIYNKDFVAPDDNLDDWLFAVKAGTAAEWTVVRDGQGCAASPANWYRNAGTDGIARTYVTFLNAPEGDPIHVTDAEFSYFIKGSEGTNIPGAQFRRQPGTDDHGYWVQTDFRETHDDFILKAWPSGSEYASGLGNVLSHEEWHFIRIVFEGSSIKVYCPELQADPVIEATDSTYSEGEIGFYHVQGAPTWAGFDQIDISEPFAGAKGDMEPDGDRDLFDILRVVDIILEVPPAPTAYEVWAGDLDDNEQIDLFDILALVDILLLYGP